MSLDLLANAVLAFKRATAALLMLTVPEVGSLLLIAWQVRAEAERAFRLGLVAVATAASNSRGPSTTVAA